MRISPAFGNGNNQDKGELGRIQPAMGIIERCLGYELSVSEPAVMSNLGS